MLVYWYLLFAGAHLIQRMGKVDDMSLFSIIQKGCTTHASDESLTVDWRFWGILLSLETYSKCNEDNLLGWILVLFLGRFEDMLQSLLCNFSLLLNFEFL